MTEMVDLLRRAVAEFGSRVDAVPADAWTNSTPCTEWDVRALVNHVVGANVRYRMLLQDAPLADVEATRAVDHLGRDARDAYATTAEAMVACFRERGMFERRFRHAAGERSGRELLVMRIYDIGVHTWDLARSIDADERIDADVVAIALTMPSPSPAANDQARDRSAQHELLVRSGRQPDREVAG